MRPLQFGTLYRTTNESKALAKKQEWEAAGKQVAMISNHNGIPTDPSLYLLGVNNTQGVDDFTAISELREQQQSTYNALDAVSGQGKSDAEVMEALDTDEGKEAIQNAVKLGTDLYDLWMRQNDVDPASENPNL
jgi:hypothetical protein